MVEYPPGLERLKDYGEGDFGRNVEWPDYVGGLGLGPEHIESLTRLATAPEFYDDSIESLPERWVPVHARRALGQIGAPSIETIGRLLDAMDQYSDYDDSFLEELPVILTRMGPEAIQAIEEGLAASQRGEYTRIACSDALGLIGEAYLEARERCVDVLTRQLSRHESGDDARAQNGFLVSSLINLKAVESAETIEAAFAADVVDETIAGGWPEVRYELGLGPKPPRPAAWRLLPPSELAQRRARPDPSKLVKKQRKAQKVARKQGRKQR